MAAGDQADIRARIKATLPPWFGDANPILDAVVSGLAFAWANVYAIYAYALQQARIKTATDGWLDVISGDFFGAALQRKTYQTDQSYRVAILANIFRERATRTGLLKLALDVTGRAAILIESRRPLDNGAYSQPVAFYSAAGRYGSMSTGPYEVFMKVYRPLPATPQYGISDADIYAAIDAVRPLNVTVWVQLLN
ncbi:MAG: hypothetical protein JWQ72_3343 [Polaromonas sp.]|nr:hypothetical protein [Polaromonas sp.]